MPYICWAKKVENAKGRHIQNAATVGGFVQKISGAKDFKGRSSFPTEKQALRLHVICCLNNLSLVTFWQSLNWE